jgi:hypothetical protein
MTDPKNLRLVVGEIREGLERHSREELIEILTYVFKEYVVEGASPLGVGAGALLDARTELSGMSFAELITWLQHHLDVPELGLFDVAAGRVSVRAAGRAVVIEPPRAEPPPSAAPSTAAPSTAAPSPAAAPSANPSSAASPSAAPMPLTPTPPVATAPRPAAAPIPAGGAPAPATPAPGGAAATPGAAKTDEQTESDSRFSRLEVD